MTMNSMDTMVMEANRLFMEHVEFAHQLHLLNDEQRQRAEEIGRFCLAPMEDESLSMDGRIAACESRFASMQFDMDVVAESTTAVMHSRPVEYQQFAEKTKKDLELFEKKYLSEKHEIKESRDRFLKEYEETNRKIEEVRREIRNR